MLAHEWIARFKKAKGITYDAQAARLLGMTAEGQTIQNYRLRQGCFKEEIAVKVAAGLNLHPAIVLVDQAYTRSRCPEARAAWGEVLELVGGHFRPAAFARRARAALQLLAHQQNKKAPSKELKRA